MEAKEKALELVNKFLEEMPYGSLRDFNDTKECALICADEIIEIQYSWCNIDGNQYKFWQEVKQEIEKL